MRKLSQAFRHAFNGLAKNIQTERNLQIHITALFLVTLLGFYFDIARLEWIIIMLISALVISLEIINSSLEKMADFMEPNENEKIKLIKDTAAAAVLVAAAFAIVLAILIFYPYFFTQL